MYIYFVGSSAALKQSPAGKEALSSTDSKPTLDSSVAGSTGGAAKKTTYARLQEDWSLFLELKLFPQLLKPSDNCADHEYAKPLSKWARMPLSSSPVSSALLN